MKIVKVLNNNVVIVHDAQGNEQVIMGRGLAFGKRAGDEIDPQQVEKVFALQCPELIRRLGHLVSEISLEVITTTESIIGLAKKELTHNLHESLAIGLTDHINFALQRQRENVPLRNSRQQQIKMLYPAEYAVSMKALVIIEKRLGIRLNEDEAGFIALHLVNARLHSDMAEVMNITDFMQQILNIVRYQLSIEYQPDSLSYHRFVTHLTFFAQRMLGKQGVCSDDDSLHDAVRNRYPLAWHCVEKISRHINETFSYVPGTEEQMFLAIHIERVRREALSQEESGDEV
ncbi:BglG family transcription antiterminator LicT [Erwinia psidii]|uniref:PRD domain-containing protein n=1 Tax=Erwinia psidii TaxID=69224 RepID=A0A3N6RZQ7_9GAMM|nr:PRD domain-containing protein [Erwinia psidii]MCX8955997.1 PRD domain-containing protein [Erwinia psidii]MCX8961369.1 PRD domain-containing protein [Erwinia psidii]MCX8963785.1 PRD domain-containing protein [Erwinia psidii]RQM38704.1 PRD domain-containing protein [Erwinia psidii]